MIIDIYHNIRWSRYKARVFSALHTKSQNTHATLRFTQIADTSGARAALSGVELKYHQYPHDLLFSGAYDGVPTWRLFTTLFSRAFKSNADLVLAPGYDRPEHWALLFAAVITRKKIGVFCDSTLNDKVQSTVKGWLKRLFFSQCLICFSYGKRSREFLIHYGVNPNHIVQRVQAAALPDAYTVQTARSQRVQLAPPADAPCFLYVGRLSQEKALDTLLTSFVEVRRTLPTAILVLAGSGPQMDELKAKVVDLGLQQSVDFTGGLGQESLADLYSRATCLVLPSRSEPWGLVVNEALHYGCPVVVSDNCGCVPELVLDGVTGFVFKTDEAVDLTRKLLAVVDRFTDAEQVASNCLNHIATYTPDTAASQILSGCRALFPNQRSQP